MQQRLVWFCLESLFISIFVIELVIRMCWERMAWMCSLWNWVDLVIVVVGVVETWILTALLGQSLLKNLNVLRAIRLLRLVRVARLLRMLRGFHMILNAFKEAVKSMGHVGVALIAGLYICSIFTTSTIGHSEKLKDIKLGSVAAQDRFGTVLRSMYSLFELMTLEGWDEVARPLVEEEPMFCVFFFGFIMVFTFGFLNMIVAFVVEKTLIQVKLMEKMTCHESKKHAVEVLLRIKSIFEECDADGNGIVSKAEFTCTLQSNKDVQDSLQEIGISTHDTETLFFVLDADSSGSLSMEELLEGFTRILGVRNPELDFLAVHSCLRCLSRQIHQLRRDFHVTAPQLNSCTESCIQALGSPPGEGGSDLENELRATIKQQEGIIKRQQDVMKKLESDTREQDEECIQLLQQVDMLWQNGVTCDRPPCDQLFVQI